MIRRVGFLADLPELSGVRGAATRSAALAESVSAIERHAERDDERKVAVRANRRDDDLAAFSE
jgi:hypothetical protein